MDKYYTDKLTTINKTRQKQKRPDKIKQTHTTWTTTVQHSQNTGQTRIWTVLQGIHLLQHQKQNYTRKETNTKTGTHVAMVIKYLQ